eukprot:Em0470g1a
MESTNHGEGPVAASKRRYIPLNDVLPPLETLVVAIEGSVDPDGVCCLSIPNRVLGDWANNREKNTSFVALANEYIVDEAITLNPEAARLEDNTLPVAESPTPLLARRSTYLSQMMPASEKEDTVDLRVLYILDSFRCNFSRIDGLQQLGFVAVNGFMLTMLGLNAANSIYACPKCTVHRDCRWDVSKPESYYSTTMARTLVTNRRAFASHGRTAAVQPRKLNQNVRATNTAACGIHQELWSLIYYLESESSDGKVEWTSLTGEAKKKVLKLLLPSKMKDIPLPNAFLDDVVQLWKAKRWIQLFLRIKSDGHQKKFVTPYFHVMVYHVPDAIRQFGNMNNSLAKVLRSTKMTPNETIFQVIIGMLLQKSCWLSTGWSYYNSRPERRGTTPNMLQHIGMKEECKNASLRCEKL